MDHPTDACPLVSSAIKTQEIIDIKICLVSSGRNFSVLLNEEQKWFITEIKFNLTEKKSYTGAVFQIFDRTNVDSATTTHAQIVS